MQTIVVYGIYDQMFRLKKPYYSTKRQIIIISIWIISDKGKDEKKTTVQCTVKRKTNQTHSANFCLLREVSYICFHSTGSVFLWTNECSEHMCVRIFFIARFLFAFILLVLIVMIKKLNNTRGTELVLTSSFSSLPFNNKSKNCNSPFHWIVNGHSV